MAFDLFFSAQSYALNLPEHLLGTFWHMAVLLVCCWWLLIHRKHKWLHQHLHWVSSDARCCVGINSSSRALVICDCMYVAW